MARLMWNCLALGEAWKYTVACVGWERKLASSGNSSFPTTTSLRPAHKGGNIEQGKTVEQASMVTCQIIAFYKNFDRENFLLFVSKKWAPKQPF